MSRKISLLFLLLIAFLSLIQAISAEENCPQKVVLIRADDYSNSDYMYIPDWFAEKFGSLFSPFLTSERTYRLFKDIPITIGVINYSSLTQEEITRNAQWEWASHSKSHPKLTELS